MATIQDIEAAMNSLRAEVSSIVAPQIAASITALRAEVSGSVAAALAEVRQHGVDASQHVAETVKETFQQAATGFSDEQARMRTQLQVGQERITVTQSVMEKTLETLQANLEGAVAKMASVSEGRWTTLPLSSWPRRTR